MPWQDESDRIFGPELEHKRASAGYERGNPLLCGLYMQ